MKWTITRFCVLVTKSLEAEIGILLNGPYVTVAPDLVAGASSVKTSRPSGCVKDLMLGFGALISFSACRVVEGEVIPNLGTLNLCGVRADNEEIRLVLEEVIITL